MKIYLCNKCGYTGLPVGLEEENVYFLGCPNCDSSFKKMKLLGKYVGEEFIPSKI